MKYGFIARHRTVWPVSVMCRVMTVSASGYYDWAARSPSPRSQTNARLTARIRESFAASARTYGSPRVWRDLQDWGEDCSENRVARLMQAAQLKARSKRRRLPKDGGQRPEHSIAANILDRQFEAAQPNQRWVADFTYVWTAEGWLYVAVVLDYKNQPATLACNAKTVACAEVRLVRAGHANEQTGWRQATPWVQMVEDALVQAKVEADKCQQTAQLAPKVVALAAVVVTATTTTTSCRRRAPKQCRLT